MRSRISVVVFILLLIAPRSLLAQQNGLKTYTTDDGSFSFVIPSDWFVDTVNAGQPNASLIVDNLPLAQRFDAAEEVSLQIFLPQKSFLIGISDAATPKEALARIIPNSGTPASVTFASPSTNQTPQPLQLQPNNPDVKEFMVDNRPAAFGYYVMPLIAGSDPSQLIIIADLGNDYWVSINTSSYKGGLANLQLYEPIILEVVKSMRYTPLPAITSGNPDLPQIYSGFDGIWERGQIEFHYPAGWYAFYSITPVMTNSHPDNILNTTPKPGQFIAAVQGVAETRASIDPTQLFDDCGSAITSDLTARMLVEKILGGVTSAQLELMNKGGITMTQPEVRMVNGKEIVYFRQYQGDIENLIMYIDLGNGNIPSMTVFANQGELAQFEDQLFAVAGTFQYSSRTCSTPTP